MKDLFGKAARTETKEIVKYLLGIFQAEFKQENGVYDYFENTYFCYQED